MIPDNVEKIIMTKEDYDRNVEQLLVEKLELEQELQRKDNIIKQTIRTIKELIDDSEDTTCYEITNTIKKLLIEELENSGSDE